MGKKRKCSCVDQKRTTCSLINFINPPSDYLGLDQNDQEYLTLKYTKIYMSSKATYNKSNSRRD